MAMGIRRFVSGACLLAVFSMLSISVAASEDKDKDKPPVHSAPAKAPAPPAHATPQNNGAPHTATGSVYPAGAAKTSGTAKTLAPQSSGAGKSYAPNGVAKGTGSGTPYSPAAHGPGGASTSSSTAHAGVSTNRATTHTPSNSSTVSHSAVNGAGSATKLTPHTNPSLPSHPVPNQVSTAHAGPGGVAASRTASPATKPAYAVPAGNAVASRSASGAVLTQAGSRSVVSQVNASRSGMHGINAKPLPAGAVTTHPNGSFNLKTTNAQYAVRANGSVASYSANGRAANFRPNGAISSVHAANMDIHRAPNGQRTVLVRRPDHSLLVSTGRHSGYLEQSVAFHGHSYIQRSYAYGGYHYNRYYAPYRYGGLLLAAYVTTAYFAPHFYGWAYNPWAAPVAYRWGWNAAPWYGYYGSYFAPYATYPSSAYWLTDYYLAQTLQGSYDAQQEAIAAAQQDNSGLGVTYSDAPPDDMLAAPAPTPITPELKGAIAQEVQRQLAAQQQVATAGNTDQAPSAGDLQTALRPNQVFVVADNLDASTVDQQTCGLSAGDILQLSAPPASGDPTATLRVASSKRLDCPADTQVQLSMQNLQDMQNALCANIDAGLASLRENQGNNGLPAAPADAVAAPTAAIAGTGQSGNDDVQSLLDAQWQQANQTEAGVKQDMSSG
jgi:hypothetical protein